MDVKVSVIVPVYNVEKYLIRCLNSILDQNMTGMEIILVDDGSTDHSPRICDEYAKKYKNIRVLHKENRGLGMARNSGLELATGKYVTFIDSDDYIQKDSLKKLYDKAVESHADTVLGAFCRVDAHGNVIPQYAPMKNQVFEGKKAILENVLKNMLGSPREYHDDVYLNMAVWMGIYSNELIQKHQLRFCSERKFISEDLIFDVDYYPYTEKVIVTDIVYYYYCEHPFSLTTSYKKDRYKKNIILFQEIERKCKKLDISVQGRLDRSFIGRARQCIYLEAGNFKYRQAKRRIKQICGDSYLRKRLKRYKNTHIPLKQKIFIFCMKKQLIFPMYVVSRISGKYVYES